MKASITCPYRLTEKMSVTFTLIPAAISAVIAGRPSTVAGTLIITFGRSMIAHNSLPAAIVPWVSRARRGSTSILTRPSKPLLLENIGANKSQAWRTSSVVSFLTTSSTVALFIAAISALYSAAPLIALLKILGLVVTPTTPLVAILDGSEWESVPVIFARDRSSSQIDVPAFATSLTLI